jgi:hypothetical protein
MIGLPTGSVFVDQLCTDLRKRYLIAVRDCEECIGMHYYRFVAGARRLFGIFLLPPEAHARRV